MKVWRVGFLSLLAVALLASAPASASVWKHQGSNVSKSIQIGLSGMEVFGVNGLTSTINCEVSATLTTSGGSTGTITKYSLFACFGTGTFNNCVPLAVESKGLPWTVHVNASDLTVTKMRIRRTFLAGCPITEADSTLSPTVTLDTPTEIFQMELFGQDFLWASAGALWVNAPNIDTYGIG